MTWEERPELGTIAVSSGFFRAAGIEIVRGRDFSENDGTPGSAVMVIDQQTATRVFGSEDPMGQRVRFAVRTPAADAPTPVWRTIVGISRTIEELPQPGSTRSAGTVFVPYRQEPPAGALLIVRSRLDPTAVMNAVRREVAAVDPDQPVFTVQTVEQMQAQATWGYRVFGSLFAVFALIALVLSAVGLYAVMAYSVTQRTNEIGVRMALGAGHGQISWLVMRRGLGPAGDRPDARPGWRLRPEPGAGAGAGRHLTDRSADLCDDHGAAHLRRRCRPAWSRHGGRHASTRWWR